MVLPDAATGTSPAAADVNVAVDALLVFNADIAAVTDAPIPDISVVPNLEYKNLIFLNIEDILLNILLLVSPLANTATSVHDVGDASSLLVAVNVASGDCDISYVVFDTFTLLICAI